MAEIKIAELLALQENLTGAFRYEVREARKEFKDGLAELREIRDADRAVVDQLGRDLARLDERSKLTPRGLLAGLTRKQKAAMWSAAIAGGGVVLDGLRHVAAMLFALWVKGVHP